MRSRPGDPGTAPSGAAPLPAASGRGRPVRPPAVPQGRGGGAHTRLLFRGSRTGSASRPKGGVLCRPRQGRAPPMAGLPRFRNASHFRNTTKGVFTQGQECSLFRAGSRVPLSQKAPNSASTGPCRHELSVAAHFTQTRAARPGAASARRAGPFAGRPNGPDLSPGSLTTSAVPTSPVSASALRAPNLRPDKRQSLPPPSAIPALSPEPGTGSGGRDG